jgi:hypothetical protein
MTLSLLKPNLKTKGEIKMKRLTSIFLAIIFIFALVPAVAATAEMDNVFVCAETGNTYTFNITTPHEYLGITTIGNLYFLSGNICEWIFHVIVVDDSVISVEMRTDITNFSSADGFRRGGVAVTDNIGYWTEDGYVVEYNEDGVWIYTSDVCCCGGIDLFDPNRPVMHTFHRDGGWFEWFQVGVLLVQDVGLDYNPGVAFTILIFTESEVAEFKRTGNLPPTHNVDWYGEDAALNNKLDLTELKALLSGEARTPSAPALTATPTASSVFVNGGDVAFDAYLIGGNNFFKLRDLAYILSGSEKQFNVEWDGDRNAIILTSGEAYAVVGGEMIPSAEEGVRTPAPTSSTIYLDGEIVEFTAYLIGGNNYFRLRDVGEALDFNVSWINESIVINTGESYTPD